MSVKALAIFAALIVVAAGAGLFSCLEEKDNPSIVLSEGTAEKTYTWSHEGQKYSLTVSIPTADYCSAKAIPRGTVTLQSYASYIDENADCVEVLAKALKASAGTHDLQSFILSFVQSIQYQTDIEGTGYTEYPKYPVETLVDSAGDCEDVVGLYASILRCLGYDAVMIFIPTEQSTGHMAAGVCGNYEGGEIMDKNGTIYHYAECTARGWRIGEVPSTIPFGTEGTKILGGET